MKAIDKVDKIYGKIYNHLVVNRDVIGAEVINDLVELGNIYIRIGKEQRAEILDEVGSEIDDVLKKSNKEISLDGEYEANFISMPTASLQKSIQQIIDKHR